MAEPQYVAVGDAVKDASRKIREAHTLMAQTVSMNQTQSIDWNSQAAQDALAEAGVNYSAAYVSNALGSFAAFESQHWEAGHGGNYELMTSDQPIV